MNKDTRDATRDTRDFCENRLFMGEVRAKLDRGAKV